MLPLCSEEAGRLSSSKTPDGCGSLELGLNQRKIQAVSAFRVGAQELRSMILKVLLVLVCGYLPFSFQWFSSHSLCFTGLDFPGWRDFHIGETI